MNTLHAALFSAAPHTLIAVCGLERERERERERENVELI